MVTMKMIRKEMNRSCTSDAKEDRQEEDNHEKEPSNNIPKEHNGKEDGYHQKRIINFRDFCYLSDDEDEDEENSENWFTFDSNIKKMPTTLNGTIPLVASALNERRRNFQILQERIENRVISLREIYIITITPSLICRGKLGRILLPQQIELLCSHITE